MLTLAFETSCDETCCAVIDGDLNVLSSIVSSQIDIHKLYGGVVPEIASRNHVMAISAVYSEALRCANVTLGDIAQIAATTKPGLPGAVMVGRVFAESLATAANLPFIEVNHLAGHIASVMISRREDNGPRPPFLSLVVSGGHTSLYKVSAGNKIKLLQSTSDDACGEAFDKVAKILGLGYPGGVQIERLAQQYCGNEFIQFVARPNFAREGFSYSGLKTAVLNYVNRKKQSGERLDLPYIAASFQHEAVEQLVFKCTHAVNKSGVKMLCICGGVSANKYLREKMSTALAELGVQCFFPEMQYCGDNAAMIGSAAVLGLKLDV